MTTTPNDPSAEPEIQETEAPDDSSTDPDNLPEADPEEQGTGS